MVRLHLPGLREDLAGFSGSSEPDHVSPAPPVSQHHLFGGGGGGIMLGLTGSNAVLGFNVPPGEGLGPPHLPAPGPTSAVITRTLPSPPPAHLPPEKGLLLGPLSPTTPLARSPGATLRCSLGLGSTYTPPHLLLPHPWPGLATGKDTAAQQAKPWAGWDSGLNGKSSEGPQ